MLTASRRFLGFLSSLLSELEKTCRTTVFLFRDEGGLDSIGENLFWVRVVRMMWGVWSSPKNSEEGERDIAGDGEGVKYGEGGGGGCESSPSSSSSVSQQHMYQQVKDRPPQKVIFGDSNCQDLMEDLHEKAGHKGEWAVFEALRL